MQKLPTPPSAGNGYVCEGFACYGFYDDFIAHFNARVPTFHILIAFRCINSYNTSTGCILKCFSKDQEERFLGFSCFLGLSQCRLCRRFLSSWLLGC